MNTIFNSSQLVPWSKRRPSGKATKRGAKVPVEFVPNGDETAFEVPIKRLPASEQVSNGDPQSGDGSDTPRGS
jgi:hypothetical protein